MDWIKSIFILFSIIIVSCSMDPKKDFDSDEDFPKVEQLNSIENTIFLPALEKEFSSENNAIYTATLLMCWDQIKSVLGEVGDIESEDLKIMDDSDSYLNVLADDEFQTRMEISEGRIFAEAYFKKLLPLTKPLLDKENIEFKGVETKAFGSVGAHQSVSILYYNDDADFAIRLKTKDSDHEIILLKGKFERKVILANKIRDLEVKEKMFDKNRTESNQWKYWINSDDKIRIPEIAFHLEHNFKSIENSKFTAKGQPNEVVRCYQRTAFILDKNGAKVESHAEMETKSVEEVEKSEPKNLIFDDSFMVMLKRKDSQYPYFAAFITGSELLVEE